MLFCRPIDYTFLNLAFCDLRLPLKSAGEFGTINNLKNGICLTSSGQICQMADTHLLKHSLYEAFIDINEKPLQQNILDRQSEDFKIFAKSFKNRIGKTKTSVAWFVWPWRNKPEIENLLLKSLE